MTQQAPDYALRLSEQERQRYRFMAQRAREQEAARWTAAGVVAGARIADVGCGPGAILVELARIAGDSGEVVGVEPDPVARAAAQESIRDAGLSNARVVEGTGTATGLAAGSLDVVMIRHVLFHVGASAPAVVSHCATLLRPGGHLYVVDTDIEGIRWSVEPDPDALDLTATYREFQRGRGCDVSLGPRLGPLLLAAGLEVSDVGASFNVVPRELVPLGGPTVAAIPAMVAAGVAKAEDEARWRAGMQRTADAAGATIFIPIYVAVGRTPA